MDVVEKQLFSRIFAVRGLDITAHSSDARWRLNSWMSEFYFSEAGYESLEKIHSLNKFLTKAEEEETYEEFYSDSDDTLFVDGLLNFEELQPSRLLEKIFDTFHMESSGSHCLSVKGL